MVMANLGDSYEITLSRAPLEWGTHRYTGSRGRIYGEGYIPIPSNIAHLYDLYNGNGTGKRDILGGNIFKCVSRDGLYSGVLRAQGCNRAGDIYAKQFSADGDLKAVGSLYAGVGADVGDKVRVTWVSSTEIEIELLVTTK